MQFVFEQRQKLKTWSASLEKNHRKFQQVEKEMEVEAYQ
jgi:hypothetical protein